MSTFEPTPGYTLANPEQLPNQQPEPGIDAVGPNLKHLAILVVLSAVLILGGQFASLYLAHYFAVYGHHSIRTYATLLQNDARFLVTTEAIGYGLVILAAIPLFRAIWRRGFAAGLHWNSHAARRAFGRLVLLGFACGIGIGLLGSILPMPKSPPIMADIMHSPLGAWMMFLFGITGAPLFEEMFFRGFVLPAFLNAFRWLHLRGDLSLTAYRWLGFPLSVVLTSAPFALLHAQQVSHAWAPVLLIGLVSVVLCIVRLRLDSLAASTIVHSAYNFCLFAGILIQTDGFQHLNKLVH